MSYYDEIMERYSEPYRPPPKQRTPSTHEIVTEPLKREYVPGADEKPSRPLKLTRAEARNAVRKAWVQT